MTLLTAVARSHVGAPNSLSTLERTEMFALLTRHLAVTQAQFESDLSEKTLVVRIYSGTRLTGFSTLLAKESHFQDEPITVIYSGDTIVDPAAWGSPALARAWIGAVADLRRDRPNVRCFWLLLSSGFRTYRFLPVFWREFIPRPQKAGTEELRALRHRLAQEQYGERYLRDLGIVRFAVPQPLRPEIGGVPEGRTADPHIAYFLAHNPGHAEGDELVCLTELCASNLTAAGRRLAPRSLQ